MLKLTGRPAAFLLAMTSVILLSSNATVAIVSGENVSFLWFSTLCSAVTVLILLPALMKNTKDLFNACLRQPVFLVAIVLKTINDLAFYYAVINSRSIEATVIVYLYPILNVLVGALLLEKRYARLSRKEWALIALSFVSVILLTPLSGLADLTVILFSAAAISAIASVYVVLVQVTADKIKIPRRKESRLIAVLFAGSLALHLIVVAGFAVMSSPSLSGLSTFPALSWQLAFGVVWVGIVVNIFSEALWLRASRMYQAISLKSLFYLSPVLGACYMAAFGIDTINPVVVFCLMGVVVTNFLIHQNQIDDVSYVAFLFGLISAAVVLEISPSAGVLNTFALSSDAFQTQIMFVSVLAGFIIFKAFEVYQRVWDSMSQLMKTTAKHAGGSGDTGCLQVGFDRLLVEPDVLIWSIQDTDPARDKLIQFKELMLREDVKQAYFDYFCARLSGISRPERFLLYLVCLTAIPSVLAQASAAGSGAFAAAFSCGIFLFLPVFVDDQVSFRSGRPFAGVTLRRAMVLMAGPMPNDALSTEFEPRSVYLHNKKTTSVITFGVTLVAFIATWWLLEG